MNSYFYIDFNSKQCGPFSPEELKKQPITPDTQVWCSGMTDWQPAKTVGELAFIFQNEAPLSSNEDTTKYQPKDTTSVNTGSVPNSQQSYNNQQPYGGNPQPYNQQPYNNNNQQPYNNQTQYGQQQANFRNSLNSALPIPKTWFVESLLSTIFCCPPFGIVGIINANKVESLYYAGDYDGSLKASKEAGKWTKIAFFVGISMYVLYALLYIIIIAAAVSSSSYY